MMSGTTFQCSTPHSLPVRPMPVCTSSAIQNLVLITELAQAGPEIVGRHNRPGLALYRFHDDGGDVVANFACDTQLLLNGIGVAIWHMKDVIMQRQGGTAKDGFAGKRERPRRFAVEAAHGSDKAALARIELGELHSAFNGLGAAAHEEAILDIAGSNLGEQMSQHTTQGIEQFLGWQGTLLQLRLYGLDYYRMRPARVKDAKATEAINVFAPQRILEGRATSGPLDGGKIAGLGD